MLGVLRRHWKPKRNNSRKKKDKGGTDVGHDLSLSPKESSRNCRSSRDTHQVHPEKDPDRVGVLGKDCTIVVTGQKEISLLTHPHILTDFHKDTSLSLVLPSKDGDFKDQVDTKDSDTPISWENNLKDETVDDKNSDEKQWRDFHGYVDSNIDDRSSGVIPRDNNVCVCKDESTVAVDHDDRNCSVKESFPVEDDDDGSESEGEKEKSDPAKESLERLVAELKSLIHQERLHEVHLPKEWSPKEELKQELEREKMLRTEAERRLNEMKIESERCKARLANLHDDCRKMEEVVHSMLHFRSRIEQLKHEKSSITLSYESKIRKYQLCIASLEKENFMLQNELKSLEASNKDRQKERERSLSRILLERLQLLEQENSALVLENEQQRLQYERCLDDVANQVVHALLAQKCLREDCSKLQRRVQDLEYQNCTLTFMFKHRFLKPSEQPVQRFSTGPVSDDGSKQSFQDSPSHTSQSEDSTESLASLCSDYSIHSGSSSSSLVSHPGLPKMSSPPQWLRERAVSLQTKARSRVVGSTPFFCHQSVLKRPGMELLSRQTTQEHSKQENTDESDHVQLRKRKTIQRTNRKPCSTLLEGRVWQRLHQGILSPGRRESSWSYNSQAQKKPMNCNSSKDSISEVGGLDAVETPSDDCFNVEGLPLLTSTHRLLVSTQYRPVSDIWGPQPWNSRNSTLLGKMETPTCVNSETQTCEEILDDDIYSQRELLQDGRNNVPVTLTDRPAPGIPRPTTLNVVPHVISGPAHNFNFPALEQKSHIVNKCGNVYEEVDLPAFPEERTGDNSPFSSEKCNLRHESRVSNLTCTQEESFYGIVEEQLSSCEDSENAMNTVIRKPHHSGNDFGAQQQTHKKLASSPLANTEFSHSPHSLENVPKPEDSNNLPLTQNDFSVHKIESSILGPENESPLSVGESREHGGKDEGYSTMSSDVQEIGGGVGFLDCVRQPRSGLMFNHSPSYLTFESTIPEPVAEGDERGMLSSSDSGLGFQRSLQETRQSSEEVEEDVCYGFERDLDSSLIRSEKNRNIDKNITSTNNECPEDSEKKSSVENDSDVDNILSSSDNISSSTPAANKDHSLEMSSTNLSSNHSKKNIVHPVFDKIYTLLTPRGFRAHRNDPRRVTLPFIQQSDSLCSTTYPFKHRVQTAEKATSTDPEREYNEEAFRDMLSDSSLSVSSTGSIGHAKILCGPHKSRDNYILGNLSTDETGLKLHFRKTLDTVNIAVEVNPFGSVNTEIGKDNHSVSYAHPVQSNFNTELHQENRSKSVPVKSVQENYNLQRAFSDSQLCVKSPEGYHMKSFSISTKQTSSRLNFHPLEHHMSACNLSSPPVTPSSLTPPLRRSQRQVLTNNSQHLSRKQRLLTNNETNDGLCETNRWHTKRQQSSSVSLSSVHSTSSEEVIVEEEEEFGATSLKCSRDQDLSSESGDEYDLLEHHSFVEQWLQRDGANVSTVLQNGYTYDEEEIGNWSFHVSAEDAAQAYTNTGNSWEGLSNKSSDKSYTCHLEKIQEHSLEDEFQDDFWSHSLWNSVVTQKAQPKDQSDSKWEHEQENKDSNNSNCTIPLTSEIDLSSLPVSSAQETTVEPTIFESATTDCSETYVSTATWSSSLPKNPAPTVTERMSPVGEEVEALLQDWSDLSSRQDSCCDVSVIVSEPPTCTEDSVSTVPHSTESDKSSASVLQSETTEFNKDFYMLCAVGSTRSLSASECGSHVEPEHSCPLTNAVTSADNSQTEILKKDDLHINTMLDPSVESIILFKTQHNAMKFHSDIADTARWSCTVSGNIHEDETKIESPHKIEIIKTRKVPSKLASKKNKVKESGIVCVGLSPGKSPKSSNSYYNNLSEGKRSPNERIKVPLRNASPEKKRNTGRAHSKARTHAEHESRRLRDDRKCSPGKKHSGGKRSSSSRKASKQEEQRCVENKNLNQNEERRNKKLQKTMKYNTEEEKSKKDMKKALVEQKISPEKTKSPKLNDLAGKSEKEELVTELELRLAGHSGTVADKIQELNALLADTEMEKILTTTPEKHNKLVNQENKETTDSSLERKNQSQKKEIESRIKEGCGTSWVHVEADIDLSDPKARANLLDSMMASSSSSSSSSSEEEEGEGEVEGEGEDEVLEHKYHQRLHALHRFRRHRKRASDRDAVISFIPRIRASIIDRHDFYYRYGEKEKEAVACFDFLDELSTSPSDTGSCEILSRDSAIALAMMENNNIITHNIDPGHMVHNLNTHSSDIRIESGRINRFSLDESRLTCTRRLPEEHLSSTTLNSQDGETVDHISLSDSCAESYSSSTHSLNHIS